MFYCPGGGSLWPLMAVCGVVWMLLLFYGMSVVAEVFLCPAVEVCTRQFARLLRSYRDACAPPPRHMTCFIREPACGAQMLLVVNAYWSAQAQFLASGSVVIKVFARFNA